MQSVAGRLELLPIRRHAACLVPWGARDRFGCKPLARVICRRNPFLLLKPRLELNPFRAACLFRGVAQRQETFLAQPQPHRSAPKAWGAR